MSKIILATLFIALSGLFLTPLFAVTSPLQESSSNILLTSDNHFLLKGEITDESVSETLEEVNKLVEKRGVNNYTIYLVLDSPGGSISSGSDLIESLKTVKNLQTVTLFAASMAAGIVEALPGQRNIINSGVLMFHRARGGVEGQFENGELESRLEFYKKMVRQMEEVNASRMSMSLSVYKDKVINELWILGNEAVPSGAADKVISITCASNLYKERFTKNFSIFGVPIAVTFSKCPLVKAGQVLSPSQHGSEMFNEYKKKNSWGN